MGAIAGSGPYGIRRLTARAGLAGLLLSVAVAPAAASSPASLLLFGSLEASPSVFVTTGAKVALDRLDREGFVALGSLGVSRRQEGPASRATTVGALAIGYQWFRDWGVVSAYAGPEVTAEVVTMCGCTHLLTTKVGLRLHGEVWARPSDDTLLTATLVLGTARASAWGRLAWGYRVWGAYLGPEVALYRDGTGYEKWNLGLHATDFALGRFSLRISAGLQVASAGRDTGPYAGLTLWTPW